MEDTGYPNAKGTLGMIQKGCPSIRVQKTNTRQVNTAVLAPPRKPEYLKGYEHPITFNKEDHPPRVPRPGHSALVLNAQIDGYNMARVFMPPTRGLYAQSWLEVENNRPRVGETELITTEIGRAHV